MAPRMFVAFVGVALLAVTASASLCLDLSTEESCTSFNAEKCSWCVNVFGRVLTACLRCEVSFWWLSLPSHRAVLLC